MLLQCLKKLGKGISSADRAELEQAFNDHTSKGLSEYEASIAAIGDYHKGLFDSANELRTRAGLGSVEYQPFQPKPAATPEPAQSELSTPTEAATSPAKTPPEAAPAGAEMPTVATETAIPPRETKTSKLALGVEAKAVEANLAQSFEGLPEYKTVNVTDQAQRASELLQSDPERARNIAMGQGAQPPSGLLPESVFVAVENHALANGDVDTLRDLATQSTRSMQATRMGQRIRMLGERNPDSPVSAIRQIEDARSAGVTEQQLTQARNKVQTEVKVEMKRSAPKVKDWNAFLDSIRC